MSPEQDAFAKYRVNKPSQTIDQQQPDQSNESTNEDVFAKYRVKQPEGSFESGIRMVAGNMARGLETILGTPGDVSTIAEYLTKPLANFLVPVDEEKRKEFNSTLPGSSDLREKTKKLTGDYLEPKGKVEEGIQEGSQTLASLLGPMKFRKALGVAAGSQIAKEGAKVLGLGKGSQEAAKLGTMMMITAINPRGALKYASSQYQKANELAKGAMIEAKPMVHNLNNMLSDLEKGVTTSAKNAVIKPIQDIIAKVNKNQILVEDLTAAKRDLNTIMKDPALLKRERSLLKGVGKEIDNAIKPYEKINPDFSKAYRPANEIYGAVMQGTKAADFIRKGLGGKSVLGAMVAETALGHPDYAMYTAAGYGGALAAAKTGDFFVRLAKSPELQKYYSKAITAALAEDLPSLRIYASKIEDEFNKNSPSQRRNVPNIKSK